MNNEHFAEFALWAAVGVAVVLLWRAMIRRRARNALTDEIMSKRYCEKTMSEAIVEANGDNEKARQIYVRKRLAQFQKQRASLDGDPIRRLIRDASIGMLVGFSLIAAAAVAYSFAV